VKPGGRTLVPVAVVTGRGRVSSLVVENPMIVMVMAPAPPDCTDAGDHGGHSWATRMVRVKVQLQATGPVADCRVVVSVIVPETVPVWKSKARTGERCRCASAGTVNVAERPRLRIQSPDRQMARSRRTQR